MSFLFKLLLGLFAKEGDNYVAYIKGVPLLGSVKLLFCEVDESRPNSDIDGGIDVFAAGKLGIWRLTFVDPD